MRTAKYNAVPGCPRVEVLSIDYDKAAIRSDEAEPGHALLIVPVTDLSSFEESAGEKRWSFYDNAEEATEDGVTAHAMGYYVIDPDKDVRAAFWIRGDAERYVRDRNRNRNVGVATETGDAHGEIEKQMRDRLDDLALLQKATRVGNLHTSYSKAEKRALEALGVSLRDGAAANPHVADEAQERLDEYPLCVEATTTFEVVLGTGGPDDRLLFECSVDSNAASSMGGEVAYEIDRVLYRYSWTGSAERELTGDDRETAEELARRVVPELVE